jgi:hypothetical protein
MTTPWAAPATTIQDNTTLKPDNTTLKESIDTLARTKPDDDTTAAIEAAYRVLADFILAAPEGGMVERTIATATPAITFLTYNLAHKLALIGRVSGEPEAWRRALRRAVARAIEEAFEEALN